MATTETPVKHADFPLPGSAQEAGIGGFELEAADPYVQVIELPAERVALSSIAEHSDTTRHAVFEKGEVPISPAHNDHHRELIGEITDDLGKSSGDITAGLSPSDIQLLGAELELAVDALEGGGIKKPTRRTPFRDAEAELSAQDQSQNTVAEITSGEVVDGPDVLEDLDAADPAYNEKLKKAFEEKAEQGAKELAAGILSLQAAEMANQEEDGILIERLSTLIFELRKGGYSVETAEEVVHAFGTYEKCMTDKYGKKHATIFVPNLEAMPPEYLRTLYFNPPNQHGSNDLQSIIRQQTGYTIGSRGFQLRMLEAIYGNEVGGKAWQDDPLVQRVEGSFMTEAEQRVARLPELPFSQESLDISRFNLQLQTESMSILTEAGLKPELVGEYMKAASIRLRFDRDEKKTGAQIDSRMLRYEMAETVSKVSYFGPDALNRLHDAFGMENIFMHDDVEIQTLLALDNREQETIRWLQEGDVTVVFTDVRNDHNGAHTAYNPYGKPSGRSLHFELISPGDIYRRMALLRKLGIQPATFVYQAHGLPGGMEGGVVGSSDITESRPIYLTSFDTEDGDYIHISETKFGRLVKEYMQPNRGVDCSQEDIGRKQIIIRTCSGDVAFEENGFRAHSVAEAVAQIIEKGDEGVDIYAASAVMFLAHDSEGRIVFGDMPESMAANRVVSATNKLTVERRGGSAGFPEKTYVKRTKVDGISVRRSA